MKAAGNCTFPQPVKAANRDGIGWKLQDILQWGISIDGVAAYLIGDMQSDKANTTLGMGLMTVERTLQNAIDETSAAYQQFDKARQKFRSEIGNDVASVSAAAKKISAEFERVVVALNAIQKTYTSAEFVTAVANAERLATALGAIQALQQSKLTFTVIEQSK